MEQLKEEGNKLFQQGNFGKAASTYTKAIAIDPDNKVLYSNRCACFLKLKKGVRALQDAEKAIQLDPLWIKAYYRKGQAQIELARYSDALATLKQALEVEPKNADVKKLMAAVLDTMSSNQQTASITSEKLQRDALRDAERQGDQLRSMQTSENSNAATTTSSSSSSSSSEGSAKAPSTTVETAKSTLAYDEARVLKFAKHIIDMVETVLSAKGETAVQPTVYFSSPGATTSADDAQYEHHPTSYVSITRAFESPDTVRECVGFLREYASKTDSHACCIVAPRNFVAYPRVWENSSSEKRWKEKHWAQSGVLIQLEAKTLRRTWFIPYVRDDKVALSAAQIDDSQYALVPPVFLR